MSNSKKQNKQDNSSIKQKFSNNKLSLDLSKLSYEQSIQELDYILNQLQNESLLVEELQTNFLKANLYLEHCEKLLDNLEQEIIEFNSKDLESLSNK